jgi:hypothetical protein
MLVKVGVTNKEAAAINASIGFEAIPQINGVYGGELIQWDAASGTVLLEKTSFAALKIFSAPQTALKLIQWVSGYGTDELYYQWLTQNSFDPPLTADAGGSVLIAGQAPVSINPGQTVYFYFGIALGADKAAVLANIAECETKYVQIVPVELTSFTAEVSGNSIALNWVTATEINNLGFEVQRSTDNQSWTTIGYNN